LKEKRLNLTNKVLFINPKTHRKRLQTFTCTAELYVTVIYAEVLT